MKGLTVSVKPIFSNCESHGFGESFKQHKYRRHKVNKKVVKTACENEKKYKSSGYLIFHIEGSMGGT